MQVAQQRNAENIMGQLFGGATGQPRFRLPHLVLEVSRENIVHDTGIVFNDLLVQLFLFVIFSYINKSELKV